MTLTVFTSSIRILSRASFHNQVTDFRTSIQGRDQLGHVEGLAVAAKDVGVVPCVILNGSADVFSSDVGVVVDKSDVVSDNTVAIVSCSTEVECSVDNTSLSAAEVDSVSCIAVAGCFFGLFY